MTIRTCVALGALFAAGCSTDPEYRGETAEIYFERFERAMLEAKVIRLEHSLIASDESGGARAVWEGNFHAIDQPLELRLDGQGSFSAKPVRLEIAVRGSTISTVGGPKPQRQEMPGVAIDRWVLGFTRLGLAHDLWRVARGMPLLYLDPKGREEIEISGLRFDGREQLAGITTRVLAYRATVGDLLDADVRLWMDERTGHPVQRRATVQTSSLRLRTTETYRAFDLSVESEAPPPAGQ